MSQETPHTTQFELEGVKYGFIPDLSQMSLGEYIDLEEALKETKSFHKAMSVMYRPIVKSFSNLYTVETYDASVERQEIMKSAPLGIASSAVVFFLSYRKRVTSGFPALFTVDNDGESDYSREAQFSKKYGWFNSLYALSKGSVTKFKAVTEVNHLEALMYLEFEKEKAEIERLQYRKKR